MLAAGQVAINTVVAGCLPEDFPVLLTAVRCLCRPEFHYHDPTLIVNGTIYKMILDFSPTYFPYTAVKNPLTSLRSISSSFRNGRGIILYMIPKSFFAEVVAARYEKAEEVSSSLALCSVRAYELGKARRRTSVPTAGEAKHERLQVRLDAQTKSL